jgi:hypothetical protein
MVNRAHSTINTGLKGHHLISSYKFFPAKVQVRKTEAQNNFMFYWKMICNLKITYKLTHEYKCPCTYGQIYKVHYVCAAEYIQQT